MACQLTPEQIASITDVEMAFSTQRLLPAREDIPRVRRYRRQQDSPGPGPLAHI